VRSNFIFILVRPVFHGNIGASARVLKNFGIRNLRFVQPPHGYMHSEARKMAVGAFDVLKEAQIFDTLDDALKDVNLAVATTSGQQRALQLVSLPDISGTLIDAAAAGNKVAVVFGDERNGLLTTELERCHHMVTIPTDPEFAALNMAQAIAVCAYELTRTVPRKDLQAVKYTSGAEDDELFSQLDVLLDKIEFTKKFNRNNVMTELRQFYQRAHPTDRELELLSGAIRKISRKLP
jgi:tRNA (cytidine32/uridine32-2'-O)-methyltransferase